MRLITYGLIAAFIAALGSPVAAIFFAIKPAYALITFLLVGLLYVFMHEQLKADKSFNAQQQAQLDEVKEYANTRVKELEHKFSKLENSVEMSKIRTR